MEISENRKYAVPESVIIVEIYRTCGSRFSHSLIKEPWDCVDKCWQVFRGEQYLCTSWHLLLRLTATSTWIFERNIYNQCCILPTFRICSGVLYEWPPHRPIGMRRLVDSYSEGEAAAEDALGCRTLGPAKRLMLCRWALELSNTWSLSSRTRRIDKIPIIDMGRSFDADFVVRFLYDEKGTSFKLGTTDNGVNPWNLSTDKIPRSQTLRSPKLNSRSSLRRSMKSV